MKITLESTTDVYIDSNDFAKSKNLSMLLEKRKEKKNERHTNSRHDSLVGDMMMKLNVIAEVSRKNDITAANKDIEYQCHQSINCEQNIHSHTHIHTHYSISIYIKPFSTLAIASSFVLGQFRKSFVFR